MVHLNAYGFIKVFKIFAQAKGEIEYVTTDMELMDIKNVAAQRWKIVEYHRGLKQTTGIEKVSNKKPEKSKESYLLCNYLVCLTGD